MLRRNNLFLSDIIHANMFYRLKDCLLVFTLFINEAAINFF
jgi:hypothetical protein